MLTLLVACTGASGPGFHSASTLPDGARKPDGVAVDLVSEPPACRATAETGDGVVTLQTPLGTEVAMSTLDRFFKAVLREDIVALSGLTSPTAVVRDPRSPSTQRLHNLGYLWRQRFGKFDYSLLSGRVIYRQSDVRTYHASDLDSLPYELKAAAPGEAFDQADLVIRVPVIHHSVKNDRLFGNELTFWLRREDGRYLIYGIAEEVPS